MNSFFCLRPVRQPLKGRVPSKIGTTGLRLEAPRAAVWLQKLGYISQPMIINIQGKNLMHMAYQIFRRLILKRNTCGYHQYLKGILLIRYL